MIIDIRGTHGSGKTWIVHQLIEQFSTPDEPSRKIYKGKRNPVLQGHEIHSGLAVVGPYNRVCGGADGAGGPEQVVAKLKYLHDTLQYPVVLIEGILVSHTYGRYAKLAQRYKDYWFCFLDTPLRTCISRVKKRRKARGQLKEFNPANLIRDHATIWTRVRAKATADGLNVKVLHHKDPIPTLMTLMGLNQQPACTAQTV